MGQIVVHGHHVNALTLQSVEIAGQRGHQRLALTSAHFRDLAAVEHDAADHLDIEMAHAQHALAGLAHGGKCLGQDVVERLARGQQAPQLRGLHRQGLVRQASKGRLERIDLLDDLVQRLDVTVVGRAENGLG